MDVELAMIGLGCLLLGSGHTAIGLRWVLPALDARRLPATPFGPPALTAAMVRFTWHVVGLQLAAFAVLFFTLAASDADPQTLLLRWFAAFWLLATAGAVWSVRRRLRSIFRFPVPALFAGLAVVSWTAST